MTVLIPPSLMARCEDCGDRLVCYPGGNWIGADSHTRECSSDNPGVLHWAVRIRAYRPQVAA